MKPPLSDTLVICDMDNTLLTAKEGIPAQVVEFAQGVIDAQGPEIDRMNAMLEAWGQQPVTDSGAWGPWMR